MSDRRARRIFCRRRVALQSHRRERREYVTNMRMFSEQRPLHFSHSPSLYIILAYSTQSSHLTSAVSVSNSTRRAN